MTRAFVIEGTMMKGDAFTNVIGIAFLPDTLKTLTGNMLENMGFRPAKRDRSLKFEAVATNGDAPPEPTLYFYEKSAANRIVSVARLDGDGTRVTVTNIALDERRAAHPRYVIPAIAGSAAVRFGLADAANAPNGFRKPNAIGAVQRQSPVFAR